MRVYLAGEREMFDSKGRAANWAEETNYVDRLQSVVNRRLFSFFYHGYKGAGKGFQRAGAGLATTSADVANAHAAGMDLFLDSGAFTAFTQDQTIGVEEYAGFIHQTRDMWSVCSCLDDIGNARGSYENQKALESNGVQTAPVFHCREDVRWLVKYLDEGYDYILLGGMVPESSRYLLSWLDDLWGNYLTNPDGTPRVKVHGFGLTDQTLMFRYPWFSVDSSSWLMTGIFGSCVFATPAGLRKVVFSEESPEARKWTGWHYDRLSAPEREQVDQWAAHHGVTAAQLKESYVWRDIVNAATFQQMEAMAATTFRNQQQGLFDA